MSFYCPQCNNLYTKITPNFTKTIDDENSAPSDTPSTVSSFKSSEHKQKGGASMSDGDISNLIKKILKGDTIDEKEVKDIKLEVLVELPSYKKLTGKQKEAVYNIINDKIPKTLTAKSKTITSNRAHFECVNCGFAEPIKDGTLLIRRSRDTQTVESSNNIYKELINDPVLPVTRAYICPNKSCKSHEDHKLREAVMFRAPNSMKIEYVCKTCSFHWL